MLHSTELNAGVLFVPQYILGCACSAADTELMRFDVYMLSATHRTMVVLGGTRLVTSVGMLGNTKVQITCKPCCKFKFILKQLSKTQNNEIVWSTSCMHVPVSCCVRQGLGAASMGMTHNSA